MRPVSTSTPQRLALWLALPLVLACANQREAGGRSRGDDAAPTGEPSRRSTNSNADASGAREATPANATPIHVVAVDPGQAAPCERMCGRVGDCLLTEESTDAAAASRLELACLDTCVHADPQQRARQDFQQCEAKQECSAVLSCARASWDAAAATRIAGQFATEFAVVQDECESGCMVNTGCSYYGLMPAQLSSRDSNFDMMYEQCLTYCRQDDTYYSAWGACAHSSDCYAANTCMTEVMRARGIWP